MYCIKAVGISISKLILVSAILVVSMLTANAQLALDRRLIGDWIKVGAGDLIKIHENGDIELFLSGQAAPFSGNGSIARCIEGGANLCLTGRRLKCEYRSSFAQGKLNLQFRTGSPDIACKAAAGDFRRREE